MLYKESVVSWFKGLNGDERIDLMCLLLDCCLPWEVRFLGTYLESLAQKDYASFRRPESTANNPSDLGYLYCIEDSEIRKRLCISVALLHSTNRQAAGVLFAILKDLQVQFLGTSAVEEEILTEISLLLTMTANHPAFSFHQKNILRSKLKQLRESRSSCSDLSEECFETVSESSTTSSTFFSDPEPADNDEENHDVMERCEEESRVEKHPEPETIVSDPKHSPQVYVKHFKVVNIQKKFECKSRHEIRTRRDDHEYVLEVTWSDDSKETICRTYEEMFDFQCKLRKLFPNKVDEEGQPWKLPFLPGRIRSYTKEHKNCNDRIPIPDIGDYARLFGSSLPVMVLGCDHVIRFFQSYKKPRLPDSKSRRNALFKGKKASKIEDKAKCKNKEKEKERERINENDKVKEKEADKEKEKGKEKAKDKETPLPGEYQKHECSKDGKKDVKNMSSKSLNSNISDEESCPAAYSATSTSNSLLKKQKNENILCKKEPKTNLNVTSSFDKEFVNGFIENDENQNHVLALSSSSSMSSSLASSTASSSSGEENNANTRLTDAQIVASLIRNIKEKNGISKLTLPSTKPSTTALPSGSVAPSSTPTTERGSTSPTVNRSPFQNGQLHIPNGFHSTSSLNSPLSQTGSLSPSYSAPALSPLHSPTGQSLHSSPSSSPSLTPGSSPSFRRRSSTGSLNWIFKSHSHSMTVHDWLKSLRLHKYSDLFHHNTFEQMLKISDKDMEMMGMTVGARRKLRANLEVLRSRGCFTADGYAVVDILPSPTVEGPLLPPYTSSQMNGLLSCGSGLPHPLPGGLLSPGPRVAIGKMFHIGDSDSASECGSDVHSESNFQMSNGYSCKPLNGCRLFCYNCGSLGHIGGQCMAPNMDKRVKYYGFHLKYDSL